MISFDEAAAIVASVARPLGKETVALADAHGRILADDVQAMVTSPPRAVSSMDGYAVSDEDLATLPVRLPIVQEIFAGAADPAPLARGECARIFTGAPVPPGADRVVIQELVERAGVEALFSRPASASRHIRGRGSDFELGATLVEAGRELGARELVTVAGGDHGAVTCWRRPRVTVIATGDELAKPGSSRDRIGAIPESVSPGVAALAREWGGELVGILRLADALEVMETAAAEAVAASDLVVVTGGASVGAKDFAKRMFEPLGLELHFSKVAMKPGKPVWLGQCGTSVVMGLPGNPTSAMVTARLLLAPLVAGLAGRDPAEAWHWEKRTLCAALAGGDEREAFIRCGLAADSLRPLGNQDSGAQATLAAADFLARVAPHAAPLEEGHIVEALRF